MGARQYRNLRHLSKLAASFQVTVVQSHPRHKFNNLQPCDTIIVAELQVENKKDSFLPGPDRTAADGWVFQAEAVEAALAVEAAS